MEGVSIHTPSFILGLSMRRYSRDELIDILFEHADFGVIGEKFPGLDRVEAARLLYPRSVKEEKGRTRGALRLWTDGASRGNPGEAGIGIVIRDEADDIHIECCRYIGRTTNNEAEYIALITGLQEIVRFNPVSVSIYMDSELIVRQLEGTYRVRHERLQGYHRGALELLAEIPDWTIQHIPRARNADADKLANYAIDEKPDELLFRKNIRGPHLG